MKTKLFGILAGLPLGAILLIGAPALARDHYKNNASTSCWHHHYAFDSHRGWIPGHEYDWNGHHYHWYHHAWFVIDPFPVVAVGYAGPVYPPAPVYAPGPGGNLGADVQAALARQGYYHGAVDGEVGPHTHAAIAAYQRDHGMYVTGDISPGLVHRLGIE